MFRTLLALAAAIMANASLAAPAEVLLTPKNTVVFRGEVDSKSVSEAIAHLSSLPSKENVYLFISSPGGSIQAGNELIRFMGAYKGHITCIAETAASMAFAIFQACPTRLVFQDSIIMQHEASFGIEGQTPNNISFMGLILSVLDDMNNMEAKRLGMTPEALKRKIRDDWWLYGEQAVQAKAADGTVKVLCSADLIKTISVQDVKNFFFYVKLTWSGCPLLTHPIKVEGDIKTPGHPRRYSEELEKYLNSLNQRDKLFKSRNNGFVVP